MKNRLIGTVAVAVATILSACGKANIIAISPVAFVHASAAKTAALKTYKMDMKMTMSGKISLAANKCGPNGELPPTIAAILAAGSQGQAISPQVKAQMCAQLAAQANKPPQPYSSKMTSTGSFRAPSDYGASMTVSVDAGSPGAAPVDVSMKFVHVGSSTYVTDPRTGAWTTFDKLGSLVDSSTFNNLNAGAYSSVLDGAKSVKDLGDTKLGGTAVHHYLVTLDPDLLVKQALKNPALKDPAMQQLMAQYAESFRNSPTTVETWIGIDDQLLRREVLDVTPSTTPATGAVAPISDLKQHLEIDLHDFNGKVDIVAPTVN